jgi:hypothetical protein
MARPAVGVVIQVGGVRILTSEAPITIDLRGEDRQRRQA